MTEKTPLFILSSRIVDELDKIISDRLMQWRMFGGGGVLLTKDYYGKQISYSWVKYEGSPREVLMNGFVEPFLENGIIDSFGKLKTICKEKNVEPEVYYVEMKELLNEVVSKAYSDLAETDRVLRGKGNPKSVNVMDVSGRISSMKDYLNNYYVALIHKADGNNESRKEEIFELKPKFYGVGVDLKALWRKLFKWYRHLTTG